MRIESPQFYKYFLQTLKEEPVETRRYALVFVAVAILAFGLVFHTNSLLLLFLTMGYSCLLIGYAIAKYSYGLQFNPIQKKVYEKLVLAHQFHIVCLRNKNTNKIIFSNNAFKRAFGPQIEHKSSVRLGDFIYEQDIKKFLRRPSKMLSIEPYRTSSIMVRLKQADGSLHWAEVAAQKIDRQLELLTIKQVHYSELQQQANRSFTREISERYYRSQMLLKQRKAKDNPSSGSCLHVV